AWRVGLAIVPRARGFDSFCNVAHLRKVCKPQKCRSHKHFLDALERPAPLALIYLNWGAAASERSSLVRSANACRVSHRFVDRAPEVSARAGVRDSTAAAETFNIVLNGRHEVPRGVLVARLGSDRTFLRHTSFWPGIEFRLSVRPPSRARPLGGQRG